MDRYKVEFITDKEWDGVQFAKECEHLLNSYPDYLLDRVVHCFRPHEGRTPDHTPNGDYYLGGGGGTWGCLFVLRLRDVEEAEEIRPKVFMPTPSTLPKGGVKDE